MDNLDRIDIKILRELQANGRTPITTLASKVGLSKTPCQNRIRRLEAENYILGYTARLNLRKLGSAHIAFVQVKLSDTRSAALKAFNEAVHKLPEIEQCHMIAGPFDYLLKVRSSNIDTYRQFLGEKISGLPYIAQTSTFVAMESVKDQQVERFTAEQ